ncbi:hypothetical protein HMN09_00954800 [Mycena chlorophos]|uniref:Uncharacterized protein n=1 Tax=Mycena chlorophos TaxID=658473 RepID=A0A8H6W2N4_MYCCL|nr:hypothetical protein HMN09_00954800 [Mycena chlorophos]
MGSDSVSPLAPIDPSSVAPEPAHDEKEKSAPWIVRKLVGSMTGRVVMSSYETLRAAGTSVVCLSPWGDSSPFLLPCIRFRDLAVHTIVVATGGMAVVAAPVMGAVGSEVIGVLGDTILVEMGVHAGFELTAEAANDMVIKGPLEHVIPTHGKRLETTAVKALLITLKYKITMEDAALGFFRSSIHKDNSLFSTVKDYLAVEKGWFSPYLFASSRRPIIPRTMSPDVVFCHSPFLQGDYQVGQTLLKESALVITFSAPSTTTTPQSEKKHNPLAVPKFELPTLSNHLRSRPPSPHEPDLKHAVLPTPPQPRRMVVLLVGLKPHRALWATSARPGESVINYILLNGCPAIVVPVKVGAPLVAWDTLTLEELWKVSLPAEDIDYAKDPGGKFGGIVKVLFEYLDMCVEWERFEVTDDTGAGVAEGGGDPKMALKAALTLLVAAAIRSKESKEVKKEIDKERAGIAMWRIP